MYSPLRAYVALTGALGWSFVVVTAQGNTTCKTSSLDWYTSTVGETPCQTYQQLRQICNAAYNVGSLSPATPPDICNDQVAGCCCNSISFALSMLCLNCQQGVGTGISGDNGIDAGAGAYQQYIGTCSPNVNQSLPNDVQTAVCNEKLKIDDDLYGLFWNTGAWFYIYTRETIQKNQKVFANNTFTHCASTTIDNSTSTMSAANATSGASSATSSGASISTNRAQASSDSTPLSTGAKAGIIAGGIVVLLLIGLFVRFLQNRRSNYSSADKIVSSPLDMEQATYQIEPFEAPPGAGAVTSTTSYNDILLTSGPSETEHSSPSQPLLSASNRPQPSSRSEKGGPPVILQPDSNDSLPTASPPLSTSHSSTSAAPASSALQTLDVLPERHADGGPLLGRSPSGRLPPAYGEQRDHI